MNEPRHWRVPGAWSGCVAFFLLTGFLYSQASAQTLPTKLGDHGASAQFGASAVLPELVESVLPPGLLQHTFAITVQAMGVSTFSTPAPMTFPNVFTAPPGTRLNLISSNKRRSA